VSQNRTALFRGRHFEDVIIILCVRWYLRYSLSYRDLEEMMVERGLLVDHVTIWRWVQHYAPILNQRLRREVRHPNGSWRVDETYVRVGGEWAYLCRALDSAGGTIDFLLSPKRDLTSAKRDLTSAKLFLRLASSGTSGVRPRMINVDGSGPVAFNHHTLVRIRFTANRARRFCNTAVCTRSTPVIDPLNLASSASLPVLRSFV
jgi:transposase, IS6 family